MSLYESESYVECDKGEIFVVTQAGFDRMPECMKKENCVGAPMKGCEYSVPEKLYVRGYFEKMDEDNLKKN